MTIATRLSKRMDMEKALPSRGKSAFHTQPSNGPASARVRVAYRRARRGALRPSLAWRQPSNWPFLQTGYSASGAGGGKAWLGEGAGWKRTVAPGCGVPVAPVPAEGVAACRLLAHRTGLATHLATRLRAHLAGRVGRAAHLALVPDWPPV
ncbi:hypothetical protein AB5I41_27150 [Sphingomonas sp. MMS24-JH45]